MITIKPSNRIDCQICGRHGKPEPDFKYYEIEFTPHLDTWMPGLFMYSCSNCLRELADLAKRYGKTNFFTHRRIKKNED
jgi:hypothetical protein